jgi:hypothetical protein
MIRRLFFSQRDHARKDWPDERLFQDANDERIPNAKERNAAKAELDTRAWIRTFWGVQIVSWISLLISVAALAVSILRQRA